MTLQVQLFNVLLQAIDETHFPFIRVVKIDSKSGLSVDDGTSILFRIIEIDQYTAWHATIW
jgi:hypothetical protein